MIYSSLVSARKFVNVLTRYIFISSCLSLLCQFLMISITIISLIFLFMLSTHSISSCPNNSTPFFSPRMKFHPSHKLKTRYLFFCFVIHSKYICGIPEHWIRPLTTQIFPQNGLVHTYLLCPHVLYKKVQLSLHLTTKFCPSQEMSKRSSLGDINLINVREMKL